MSHPYLFLGLASLVLSGCAPAWTQKSLIAGPRFSYAVGEGVGVDEESAGQAAEIAALAKVLRARPRFTEGPAVTELIGLASTTCIISPTTEVIENFRTKLEGTFPIGWQAYG